MYAGMDWVGCGRGRAVGGITRGLQQWAVTILGGFLARCTLVGGWLGGRVSLWVDISVGGQGKRRERTGSRVGGLLGRWGRGEVGEGWWKQIKSELICQQVDGSMGGLIGGWADGVGCYVYVRQFAGRRLTS